MLLEFIDVVEEADTGGPGVQHLQLAVGIAGIRPLGEVLGVRQSREIQLFAQPTVTCGDTDGFIPMRDADAGRSCLCGNTIDHRGRTDCFRNQIDAKILFQLWRDRCHDVFAMTG